MDFATVDDDENTIQLDMMVVTTIVGAPTDFSSCKRTGTNILGILKLSIILYGR